MTLYFASHEIIILRNRRIGSSDRYTMSATFTALPADIQPIAGERVEYYSNRLGATHTAFISPIVNIKEGDYIQVIGEDTRYAVRGVNTWAGAGMLDHKELILASKDG